MNVCLMPSGLRVAIPGVAEDRIYVNAGSFQAAQTPTVMTTVLSSSVAVCLWSDVAAGLNHFVLPQGTAATLNKFLEKILDYGSVKRDIIAAIFGGASILGQRNVAAAREFLRRHDIPVVREDVGGSHARKLTFRTVDGSTIVRGL